MTAPSHPEWLRADDAGVVVTLRVVPRARRNDIAGVQGDALKIRLAAPPVEGAANRALIAFLARRLGVRRRQVSIEGGDRSRQKRVRISGVGIVEALERLWPTPEP